jgi:hypothetical protein
MSKKLIWIAAFMMAFDSFSQDCQGFLFLQQNKTIELTFYNKKGEPNGKEVYQVSNVVTAGNTTSASLNSEMFDKNGNSMAKAASSLKCTTGTILIDMKMLLPQQQSEKYASTDAKAQSTFLEYPSVLHIGDALKDGNLIMDLSNHSAAGAPGPLGAPGPPGPPGPPGMGQTLKLLVTDRKVEAQESITTPAGTWNCYKISFKSKLTVKTGPFGIPTNLDGTEWYAPGFGIVKTQSKNGGTAITSIK